MCRGSDWGEGGYIRLRRGQTMCGVGQQYAVAVCRQEEGTTSAPVTTSTPCTDKYQHCAQLAQTNCKGHGEHCPEVRSDKTRQKSSDLMSELRPVRGNDTSRLPGRYEGWPLRGRPRPARAPGLRGHVSPFIPPLLPSSTPQLWSVPPLCGPPFRAHASGCRQMPSCARSSPIERPIVLH